MNPCELTHQQTTVLDLICDGLMNKQIAAHMGISPRTVESHRAKAMRIIGAKNAVDAALIWRDRQRAGQCATLTIVNSDPAAAPANATFALCDNLVAPFAAHDRPTFAVWFDGRLITRNGDYFAECNTPEIAHALTLALNSAQLLFDPAIPAAAQDYVAATLWPSQHAPQPSDRRTNPSAAPSATQPLDTALSQPWEP